MMHRLALLGLLLGALAACNGDNGTGPSATFAGEYRGIERANFGTTSITFSMSQVGDRASGTYANGVGDRGTLDGTVSGTSYSGVARSSVQRNLRCDFTAALHDGGARVTGTFACNDGTRGTVEVTRV